MTKSIKNIEIKHIKELISIPQTTMINQLLSTRVSPIHLKLLKLNLYLNKDYNHVFNTHRPISLLPVTFKIFVKMCTHNF